MNILAPVAYMPKIVEGTIVYEVYVLCSNPKCKSPATVAQFKNEEYAKHLVKMLWEVVNMARTDELCNRFRI